MLGGVQELLFFRNDIVEWVCCETKWIGTSTDLEKNKFKIIIKEIHRDKTEVLPEVILRVVTLGGDTCMLHSRTFRPYYKRQLDDVYRI